MRKITINISDNIYEIESGDIYGFELLGILEQVIFDLKTAVKRKEGQKIEKGTKTQTEEMMTQNDYQPQIETSSRLTDNVDSIKTGSSSATSSTSQVSGIRLRIGNAVKAINDLGGQIGSIDLKTMSDEELQVELEELTSQYKRLKNSKKASK